MATTPIFPVTIQTAFQQILPADASALKTLYTGAANGTKIDNILISSTDTSNRDLVFYITSGGIDYQIATISCIANSGNTNAIYPIGLFSHVAFNYLNFDPMGNHYMYLKSGDVLKVKSATTVTAAKAIQFTVQAGDY